MTYADSYGILLSRAKELGFETVDLAIAYPDKSLLKLQRKEKAGIEVVATTTLQKDWNSISSNPEVRKDGVKILKNLLI